MPYGLVSSPVVAFDLVRHPSGPSVARVLRYAVGAGAAHVRALADAAPPALPGGTTPEEAARRHAERAPGEDGAALARVALQAGDPAAARALLARAPVGGLADVLALLRERVVPQCWERPTALHPPGEGADVLDPRVRAAAADAVAHALVRAWTGRPAPDGPPGPRAAERRAAGPDAPGPDATGPDAPEPDDVVARAAALVPPRPVPLGPAAARVEDALARLAAAPPEQLALLRRASGAEAAEAPGAWARAVHDVSAALERAGLTEAAACVQLEAVVVARRAGLDAAAAAAGAWPTLSGALHALCAGAVGPAARRLVEPLERAVGAPAGAAPAGLPRPRGRGHGGGAR
ncbi:hypothetical protein [uncultured Pseudokineococcus sp.]|uniref:hypothetical protein n=1 Tax=uncultured Pseudokineococcus sp. TaxID=1642928 RepID=UPI00260AE9BA|nr:hypothetical protein [uncultured Pseudokineococcus sp.]